MADVSWTLNADFNLDGTYETTLADRLEAWSGGFSVDRGIGPDGAYQISQVSLTLANRDGELTPEYNLSTLFGLLRPQVPIQIVGTHNAIAYTVWTGYITDYENEYAPGGASGWGEVSITAQDIAAFLSGYKPLRVTVSTARDTDGALVAIDDVIGLVAGDRNYDDGVQNLDYHFVVGQDGLTAKMEVVKSEMGGLFWVMADGRQRFESRASRLKPYAGKAGQFTSANSEYLSIADNASLSTGDIDFTIACWVYLDTAAARHIAISKWGGAGEYFIDFWAVFRFYVASAGGDHQVLATGSPSAGQWYFIVAWHDSVANAIYIQVNNAAADSQAHSTGVRDDAGSFDIGAQSVSALYWNGRIDSVGFWKRTLTTAERTWLYNSGQGRCYGDIGHPGDGSALTTSLISWWDLEEASGTRNDSHGTNHLTDNNTVTQAGGIAIQPGVDHFWGDGTNIIPSRVRYRQTTRDLVTRVDVMATVFAAGQADTEILRFSRGMDTRPTADSMQLTANIPYECTVNYEGLASALTAPEANVDYLLNDAANGSGTDRTANLTVTATDRGGQVDLRFLSTVTAYLTKFRLRGTPVVLAGSRPQFISAKSVSGIKADRGIQLDIPFATADTKAADYSYCTLRTFRYPYPLLELEFLWRNDDIKVSMLSVELGDLVLYNDTGLTTKSAYVNDWWFVERVQHSVPVGGATKSVIVLTPSYIWRNLDKCAYDLFTRANAVGDLSISTSGDTWADDAGFDIASNKAVPNAVALQAPNIQLSAADHVVEVSLSNMSADTDEEVGVVYRYVDSSNYWRAYLDDGTDEVILEKVLAGVVTEKSSPAWTPTDTAELRVICQGNRHRVWLGFKLVIDVTDSDLNTGTKVGLFSRSTTAVQLDDFYAEALTV